MVTAALVVLGIILGSFVNALVWRLHERVGLRERLAKLRKKKKPDSKKIAELMEALRARSVWQGRSMCPACEHELAAKDLVPVLSWLWLRGKCRYCGKKISAQYPVVELVTGGLFGLSYAVWPLGLSGYGALALGFWLVFLVGFVALAVYDLRWFTLPDKIVYFLIGLAILQVLLHIFVFGGGAGVAAIALWGVAFDAGIFGAIYVVSLAADQAWIGLGDVKLGVVLGLLVGGPFPALLLLFISSLIGTFVSLPLLISRRARRDSLIPYGPFLLLACGILVLFGGQIIGGLQRLLLL
jgi:leader peptidase (prepilin peptidase)/N-methyltransferase